MNLDQKQSAVVLLSGGQDSTTALFWAKERFHPLYAVTINYGQRHVCEIKSALNVGNKASVIDHIFLSIDSLYAQIVQSSGLLNKDIPISSPHKDNPAVPASFVPGRNLMFLNIAAIIAYERQCRNIIIGACQTDYSGYPDCRDTTIKSINIAINFSLDYGLEIHTPLMWIDKAGSVMLATTLPGCMEALAWSHTCYEGEVPPCMKCPACILRAEGFDNAGFKDPLLERLGL